MLECAVGLGSEAVAPDPVEEARELLLEGKYRECSESVAQALAEGPSDEALWLLKLESELQVGAYGEAVGTLEASLLEHPYSIALRWHGRPALLGSGQAERAAALSEEIDRLVRRMPRRYTDPSNQVVVGRYLLFRGADSRTVLEQFFDPIKKQHPDFLGAYLASGDLALEKQDGAVAAQEFSRALKLAPEDPAALFGLARALADSDPPAAGKRLLEVLERNPNHVGAILRLVDAAVDREDYEEASTLIRRVLSIHPAQSAALAYRAVVAHVAGDFAAEKAARKDALGARAANPEVDHLIGRKLSQKYRFAEGAAYQRSALARDPAYLPSMLQLCQDLLRLGREEEGWRLAKEVYERDGYSVVAHNLNVLREHLSGFARLEAPGIVLRMDSREAAVYGERALDLLVRAKETLCARYEVELREPVVVEIFPEQKDFAIRTFGLPGGAGFLGVCFGSVITANSPASQGQQPANWEAVLWHELCHVVTLGKTRNRIPRWLSEGISVYEERRADPSWGQAMIPQYLDIVAAGGVSPASRLSGAFLQPPTPAHLEFAYFQSSLAVECLIERYGFETFKAILSDLADGRPINAVLEGRTGSLEDLDSQVEAHVRSRVADLASKADWTKPEIPEDADLEVIAAWNAENPRSFRGLQLEALRLVSTERWAEAKGPLERLLDLCPEYVGPDNAYELLAKVHRQLSDPEAELRTLQRLTERDSNAIGAGLRLLDLCAAEEDWAGLASAAESLLSVNPLIKAPHQALVTAARELGTPGRALRSYRALLAMEPADPAGLHLGLARVLRSEGRLAEAKRELLQALEEAPRYRDAHRELLALAGELEARRDDPDPVGAADEAENPEEAP